MKFHKGGEYHETNPDVVRPLHRTVDPTSRREDGGGRHAAGPKGRPSDDDMVAGACAAAGGPSAGAPERYARFAALVDSRLPTEPRDLL